jgi:hypothetical protein
MFLGLDLPGIKDAAGDGPQLEELWRKYPQAGFPGAATAQLFPSNLCLICCHLYGMLFFADAEPKEFGWSR